MRGEAIDPKRVSIAKAYLGEMVNRVAYHALQIHGGYGYMEEYRISRIYRDVRALVNPCRYNGDHEAYYCP